MKSFSESGQSDADEDMQKQPPDTVPAPIPVPIQIQIVPMPVPQTAPLAAELTLTPAEPDALAAAPEIPTPLPSQNTRNLSLKLDEQPPKDEKPDQPLRPPTTHFEAKVAGVDDLNALNRPSTRLEWMASPPDAQGEQTAKSVEPPEVAFTATIKEAVQPVKAQTSGGKSGQQDSNPHERTTADTTQSAPQSAAQVQIGGEKSFHQTVTQAKPAEAAKVPDMTPIHPVLNERPVNTGAVNSLSLRVDSENSGVDVKLMERGGTIQLSVRTSDRELAGDLRGRLNELVDGLSGKGYETQVWTPETNLAETKRTSQISEPRSAVERDSSAPLLQQVTSTFQAQNDPRHFNQGGEGKGGAYEDQSGGRNPKGGGQQQGRQNDRREEPKNTFRTILEGARP